MIERQTSADRINQVINHPSVYPWVRGSLEGELDLSNVISDTRNFALFGEHGGVIFKCLQPGIYEAHTQVVPEGRGSWTIKMVRAALQWMFTRTDALEIVTQVPRGNVAALALTRRVGFVFEFTNPKGWVKDGKHIESDIYGHRIQDWMRIAPDLCSIGHHFHDQLEEKYRQIGRDEPSHADDVVHDRYVGAAFAMVRGGQPHKAQIFYNRWAALAGYEAMRVLSVNPMTIDIRDAIIVMNQNDFQVELCQ